MTRHQSPTRPRGSTLGVMGLLLVTIGAPAAWAQNFPTSAPVPVMLDDFETDTLPRPPDDPLDGSGVIWDEWIIDDNRGDAPNFEYYPGEVPAQVRYGIWGERCIWEGSTTRQREGYLMAKQSVPGNPGWDPADWTNFRLDVDVTVNRNGIPGIAWGVHDPDNDGVPDTGYLFTIEGFPTEGQANRGNRAFWTLRRIDAELSTTVIDTGTVNLPSSDDYTRYMVDYKAFRLRLEWYCSNLRVRVQRAYNPNWSSQEFYGCGSACTNPTNDPDACWCTLAEWTDTGTNLAPGVTGLYHSIQSNNFKDTLWDNFNVSAWSPACGAECDPWTDWAPASTTLIPFKFLYESGILDYSAGRNVVGRKIDVNTEAPDTTAAINSTTTNYCNGWNLLVDLPAPGLSTASDDIRAFLQPMATAVDYVSDGSGGFSWQDHFDNDPESATYNPVPMIADGSTPINNSLLDAFDWYVDQVTIGEWANDPLRECREWYVVLITDGAESCAGEGQFACDPGQAASKFANPNINGVDKVKVFTIGFSESVADAPEQLTCISEATEGVYYGARNASELSNALQNVIDNLETAARSFTPFKISPPPSSAGSGSSTQDSLVVYPIFQAASGVTLWHGNLYGFRFNKANASIPITGNCEIDYSQVVVEAFNDRAWNANALLAEQLAEDNPTRYVFMGSDITDTWVRHDLATIPTNHTLRDEFRTLIRRSGLSNLETQNIVNFVRGIWMDDDPAAAPDPTAGPAESHLARPADSSALGDIYHSQPVIVNPPSRSMYFFDYGFGASGEEGAHDYGAFMRKHAKRRRVVLAGANDGMLHAFDGGVWDRDRTGVNETYDKIHDLGDGSELFAYVPQAVMPRLYGLTNGVEQQYMVDGPIEVGDAFIDHDGDDTREWRTVAIAAMRRGGRGLVALDITQPDPISGSPDFIPEYDEGSQFPGCIDGTNCGGDEYPKVLWEFTDTDDDDVNCGEGLVGGSELEGADCEPWWDLGWTWSKPVIARIGIYNDDDPPDDVFIAFFGGGWDEKVEDRTGRHFYGVNVQTGEWVVKHPIGAPVPAGPTVLDTDDDGFHDRVYFADSDGSVWRIQYPAPDLPTAISAEADGATGGVFPKPGRIARIWDFREDFADRQMFFHRPVAVSTVVEGGAKRWALALGSGNRANLGETGEVVDGVNTGKVGRFFFLLDVNNIDEDVVTRGAADLRPVQYTALADPTFSCGDEGSALDPDNADSGSKSYGWYLNLRPNEKVMWEAPVIDGFIVFPTFDSTKDVVATHNPPNQCVPETPPDPDPTATPIDGGGGDGGDDGGATTQVICSTSGLGRTYKLWYQCGVGEYSESNTPITGVTTWTEGNTTKAYFPTMDPDEEPQEDEWEHPANHVVTNWRQY